MQTERGPLNVKGKIGWYKLLRERMSVKQGCKASLKTLLIKEEVWDM